MLTKLIYDRPAEDDPPFQAGLQLAPPQRSSVWEYLMERYGPQMSNFPVKKS